MSKKVNCIMLIDDNPNDNFFHERVIKRSDAADTVIVHESAMSALAYLKSKKDPHLPHPDLIFLDINMPGMNGWEFLDEYEKLDKELQGKMVIIMFTTSENPDEKATALTKNILADFRTKPLTREMLDDILNKYYREQTT